MQHMSLLVGPGAKGSIGGTHTFARVKGRGIVKAKPTPANPQTAGQTLQRNDFTALVTWWHSISPQPADKIAYRDRATKTKRGLSGWNLFMSIYRKVFAAGDTQVFLDGVTAVVAAPNLTVAGNSSANIQLKISVFTETGTFSFADTVVAALGVFSKDIPLANIPSQGWVQVETDVALNGGSTGWYHYAV